MRTRICLAAFGLALGVNTAVVADSAITFAFGASTFDRDKLERSIRIALQKRPIEPERVD